MKRVSLLALLTACVLALAACGKEKDKEGLTKACGNTAPALEAVPKLPGKFPNAKGMTFTAVEKQGPTTVATGYVAQALDPAHAAFTTAVEGASGYTITKNEQDAADAEVTFSGAGNSGQVKLTQQCKDRTNVTITIRPA